MPASALTSLRNAGQGLTPALRRVADYALEQPDKVLYQTVMELAEGAGASEASVIRFCRDLGFSSFQDFKLSLAFELAVSPTSLAPVGTPQTPQGALEHLLHHAKTSLEDTAKLLDSQAVARTVGALLEARTVDFYGVGASGVTAQDFAYKFLRLGYTVRAHVDPHLAAMSAATLGPGCVALAISRSGTTLDTVRALEQARSSGAFTVALTQRGKSPLGGVAHEVLVTSVGENPLSGGSVSAKLGQLLVLDLLFSLLALGRPNSSEFIQRTAAAVADRNV